MAGKMNATAAAAAEPVRRAYVTFLPGADDGEGLKAVVRQAEDLRKVDAAYPLVVAVLPDVPESHRRILVLQGCVVREVEPVGYTEDAQVDEARVGVCVRKSP
jgi:inositol 3-alpha-galactosyltransferase